MKLISPRNQGVVSGRFLPVELTDCARRPTDLRVDGTHVDVRFNPLPYRRSFAATIDFEALDLAPGEHAITVSSNSQTVEHVFRNDLFTLDIAKRAADGFLMDRRRNRSTWNWDTAILNYGLLKLAEQSTPDRGILLHHLSAYYERWSNHEPTIRTPDKAAPALAALHMSRLGLGDFPSAIDAAVKYLRTAPRIELDCPKLGNKLVLNHVAGNAKRVYGTSIWADSLMMYAVLAAHYGAWHADDSLYQLGITQHAAFACKLLDEDTGLFQHAYRFRSGKRAPGSHTYWLRGNGWVAASLIEILDVISANHNLRGPYENMLCLLLSNAARYQLYNGLWDTILNKPGYSFVDTSGSCLLAYAILKGIRLGYVDRELAPVAQRVYSAVTGSLRQSAGNYVVTRIAGSTNALWRPAYKRGVRVQENRNFGVGAYLMLAAEVSHAA